MRACYTVVLGLPAGRNIGIIKENERGYYRTDLDFGDEAKAKVKVRQLNEIREISEEVQLAMELGSMFGFDIPACDILKETV